MEIFIRSIKENDFENIDKLISKLHNLHEIIIIGSARNGRRYLAKIMNEQFKSDLLKEKRICNISVEIGHKLSGGKYQ